MSHRFVNQLGERENIDQIFLVSEKQLRPNRAGNLYLSMTLSDRTGSLNAMMWNANDHVYQRFENGDYVHVEGNETYANGEHGIYINNSSDYFIVRGNIVHDNPNCGVHLNGDVEMGGDGILSGGLVEDNFIYANGVGGGAAINMDGVTGTLVANNLLLDNHASGIALFQENGAVCSADNRVYHNTIQMPE